MTVTAAPPKTPKKTKEWKSPQEEVPRLAAMLLSPTFAVLALVIGYPILAALRNSLYRQSQGVDESGFVVEGDQFVGIDNYAAVFSGDTGAAFWNAFYNTTFFTVVCVIIETVIGVAMALIMNKAFAAKGLIRASILIPWAIPTVVSALLWRWIFDSNGIANDILGTQILWQTDGWQAKFAVILADTWKTAPFIGLLVLAGLQTIPAEVYEAAKIDGANAWQVFKGITLPLVKPALLVAVLFRILQNLAMFDLPYVLIGRGKDSVETLSILAFLETDSARFGEAATYAFLLFWYIAIVAYLFVKILGADVIGDKKAQGHGPTQKKKKGFRGVAKADMP